MSGLNIGFVSSTLSYLEENPTARCSHGQIEHELRLLKKREQLSSIVGIAGVALAMITLAGILGGGHIFFGALAAIALVSLVYVYLCRQAESALRSKQMSWLHDGTLTIPQERTIK